MITNVGQTDRIIRGIIGLVLLYLGYSKSVWFYIPALIVLFTAIVGYCGLYQLIGINTCSIKK